jgi:hypothetical protein
MTNLEKLDLHLLVCRRNVFVNGNDLKKNIIDYMPRLNTFKFNICSTIPLRTQIDLPSDEDIQQTFRDF